MFFKKSIQFPIKDKSTIVATHHLYADINKCGREEDWCDLSLRQEPDELLHWSPLKPVFKYAHPELNKTFWLYFTRHDGSGWCVFVGDGGLRGLKGTEGRVAGDGQSVCS